MNSAPARTRLHPECTTRRCGDIVCACRCEGCRPRHMSRVDWLRIPATRAELFREKRSAIVRAVAISVAAVVLLDWLMR